jgi:hypothetical protein
MLNMHDPDSDSASVCTNNRNKITATPRLYLELNQFGQLLCILCGCQNGAERNSWAANRKLGDIYVMRKRVLTSLHYIH